MLVKNKKFILILLVILIVGLILCLLTNKHNLQSNNYDYISNDTLEKIINKNIAPQILNSKENEVTFCDYKLISTEKDKDFIKVYLWIYAQNRLVKENKIIKGSSGEFAVELIIKKNNENFEFINYNMTKAINRDEAIKFFPEQIRKKAYENYKFDDNLINNSKFS